VKLSIRSKLFLTLLAATGLVVLGMYLLIQWSFDRGFLDYLRGIEEQRIAALVTPLAQVYARDGGWQRLRDDDQAWRLLLRQARERDYSESDREGDRDGERRVRFERIERDHQGQDDDHRQPSPPPADTRRWRFENRVVLLDSGRHPVLGPAELAADIDFLPIEVGRQTVGYVGVAHQDRLTGLLQKRFASQQRKAFGLISLAVVLVAALLSLPLARTLGRRIASLARATHRLAGGEFGARVAVTGTDELSRLARDFNRLAEILEQNEQARRRWIADISHELRTPLAILRGEIEALQDGVRPTGPEALASLHGEIMQLTRLVEDLYQLSLSDLGALTYRKSELDLAELIEQVVAVKRTEFAARDIAVALELPEPDRAQVYADRERLHQLLGNLLENSLRYTDAGGRLQLTLDVVGDRAVLELQDSAPGVPEADLPRLFERLYRVEGSRSRARGGAGLGLSICRSIVEAHGGTISAAAAPLGGLLVRVELPMEVSR